MAALALDSSDAEEASTPAARRKPSKPPQGTWSPSPGALPTRPKRDCRVREKARSTPVIRASQCPARALSPKSTCPSLRGSIRDPASRRCSLLKAVGRRNSPAVSPIVRAGLRALGSRESEKAVESATLGRSQPVAGGVMLKAELTPRWVSRPTSTPSRLRRSSRARRLTVELSP